MATTLERAYRYPGPGQEPDVPGDMQKLAEDVDTDVAALDAALAALAAGTFVEVTPHADYQNVNEPMTVAAQGSMAVLSGRVLRKAGKTTTVIGYVPAGYRPATVAHSSIQSRGGTTGTAGPMFHLYVNPADGALGLTVLSAATWNETHWIPFNVSWRRA